MTCLCPSCLNVGPEWEAAQAERRSAPTRPFRSRFPGPPPDWWARVLAASNVNHPDDPTAYEWHTRKDRKDATQ